MNNFGHDYNQIGENIDCDLSETEIHNLIAARNECKRAHNFQKADMIFDELKQYGVFLDDKTKGWRAEGKSMFPDGKKYFPSKLSSNNKHEWRADGEPIF